MLAISFRSVALSALAGLALGIAAPVQASQVWDAGMASVAGVATAASASETVNAPSQASSVSVPSTSTVRLPAIPTKRAAERAAERKHALNPAGTVILYRTAWCGFCKRAAAYMQQQKVPFIERDIEVNDDHLALYRGLGGKGSVPLIQFGNQVMMGFAQETFDQFYEEFKKAQPGPAQP